MSAATADCWCWAERSVSRWYKNWLANKEKVLAKYGERWYRIWEYFLASSIIVARQGGSSLFQLTLHKNVCSLCRMKSSHWADTLRAVEPSAPYRGPAFSFLDSYPSKARRAADRRRPAVRIEKEEDFARLHQSCHRFRRLLAIPMSGDWHPTVL